MITGSSISGFPTGNSCCRLEAQGRHPAASRGVRPRPIGSPAIIRIGALVAPVSTVSESVKLTEHIPEDLNFAIDPAPDAALQRPIVRRLDRKPPRFTQRGLSARPLIGPPVFTA